MLSQEEGEWPHLGWEMVESKREGQGFLSDGGLFSHLHVVPEAVLTVGILWRLILVSIAALILHNKPLYNSVA